MTETGTDQPRRIPWRKRPSGVTNGWAVAAIMGLGVLPTLAGFGFYRYVQQQRERDCEQRVESRDELRQSFLTLYDLLDLQINSAEGRTFVDALRASVLPAITVHSCLHGDAS